jgi:AcrR family transcriptional regulator
MATIDEVPIRRRMPRAERSAQLLEVAEAVFAERGIAATSMEEIADRAGITKPVLYDHFGSKDGLLAAVIDRAGAELGRAVEDAVLGAKDADDALARGLTSYFTFMAKHRAAWLALLNESATGGAGAEALERIREERARFIAALIAAEVPGSDHERAMTYAQAVIGACERLATAPHGDEVLTPETLTSHLMDVIWLGFGAVRAGKRWS